MSTVCLGVLLAVLPLQLPNPLPVLLQERASHPLDSFFGSCHECGFDIFMLLVLIDEGVELLVEILSELQLLEQLIEVVDCC